MVKPDYIFSLEKEYGIFSIMEFEIPDPKFKEFIGNKLKIVYARTNINNDNMQIEWNEIIYKTTHPFYLYLLRKDENWLIGIYYKVEQFEELKIFVSQLLKNYKNTK
jgi:hypothetical protein